MSQFRIALVSGLWLFLTVAGAQAQRPAQRLQPLPDSVTVEKDVAYGKHERQKLDVYIPKSDKPLPLVVWIHGGGWRAGDKASGGPARILLNEGFVVASTNYRLSNHATFPAQSADVRNAIRFLRANAKKYNIDPDHVGVWGSSAGGHLVAMLGTGADVKELDGKEGTDGDARVQAVIDWFGPTDFPAMSPQTISPNGPVSLLLGGTPTDKPDAAKLASPVTHVTKDDAPTLIFHGDKDSLVPLSQSQILLEALKKAGVECELVVIEGAGHGGKDFTSEANRKKAIDFLNKHLKAK